MHRIKLSCLILLGGMAVTQFARAQSVAEITAATGVKTGLAIHIGTTDGRLETELAATGKFVVQGVATDEAALA